MLSGSSGIGGLSRGEVGGIGAIAGALLGGRSVKGAIGGGAMALLGTHAISALKNWQPQGGSEPATAPKLSEAEVEQMTAPETAELCLRSEEHTSDLQSLMRISYAVFCLKQKQHTT